MFRRSLQTFRQVGATGIRQNRTLLQSVNFSRHFSTEDDAFDMPGFGVNPLDRLGEQSFDDDKMKNAVKPETWAAFVKARSEGTRMSKEQEDEIAQQMMEWAMDQGAVNFAHWASPVRGPYNLIKHDAFIDIDFKTGKGFNKFGGSKLFLGETDGSSFPNGGLRDTHRAAAYVSWDRTSPPFVKGDTLVIPSAFITWNGEALDEKTPLLRSQEAVNTHGARVLKALGYDSEGIACNVGWEQEFFLVEKDMYDERPDLIACGRTLFGALPPRGQQTDANYFSSIAPKIKAVLTDVQEELHRKGVNVAVYHNEVAPGQHEFSPIFCRAPKSADQNILAMEILDEKAKEYGLMALCHEKPFAGINGSGKHSNWGLVDASTGRNIWSAGETQQDQTCFITMVACLLRATHLHGDIIRAGCASAGNDHRLGAQEAPPAIISLYLGEGLGEHVENIIAGKSELHGYGEEKKMLHFGTRAVGAIQASPEDRNRTAPFPWCGNRFELRAVGSNQHFAFAIAMVQAAFADSLEYLANRIESGEDLKTVVREMFTTHKDGMFNGDGYSKEWQEEIAPSRNLPNLRTTVDALEVFASDKNKEFLHRTGVFRHHEVEARQSILFCAYSETLLIEANCMLNMCNTGVLPALAADLKQYAGAEHLAGDRADIYQSIGKEIEKLQAVVDATPHDATENELARYCVDVIKPQMQSLRELVDIAERKCDRAVWPFPTYEDLVFAPQRS